MDIGALQSAWNETRTAVALIPDGMLAALLAVIAVAVALVIYGVTAALMRRMFAVRRPLLYALLTPLEGPYRLALVLLALNIAVVVAPIEATLGLVLSGVLRLCFIGLVGWMVLAAINIAADFYLQRFNIESEDNLLARKQVTQVRVLKGVVNTLIVVVTLAVALMSFEAVRQFGVSLFASAGVAGLVVGLAARPVLANLIAGVQLAITQPIRLEDTVVIENEMGFIEEITSTYVVVRLWDWRRLVVPLSYFMEKPFQNWTRETGALIGTVMIAADYTVPLEAVRAKLDEIVKASPLWDGRVLKLQVWEANAEGLQLRVLASARTASAVSDLRCEVREKLIAFLAREYPQALPHARQQTVPATTSGAEVENRRPRAVP